MPSLPDTDLILGYDFGTSSVKSAVFDPDGIVHAVAACSSPLHFPQPGWIEKKASHICGESCPSPQVNRWSNVRGARTQSSRRANARRWSDRPPTSVAFRLCHLDVYASTDIARDLRGEVGKVHDYIATRLVK